MQMINEVTVMQANKNLFNGVIACLNRCKSKKSPIRDTKCMPTGIKGSPNFVVAFEYTFGKIYTVQELDTIFFCTELTPRVQSIGGSYKGRDYRYDPALSLIMSIRDNIGITGWRALNAEFDKSLTDDGLNSNSTPDEIKKSHVYTELSDSADVIKDAQYSLKLLDGVQKKLRVRENLVPLIYYKIESGEFNYPYKSLPNGTLNATSCREVVERRDLGNSSLIRMCTRALDYTPYIEWTELVMNPPHLAKIYMPY